MLDEKGDPFTPVLGDGTPDFVTPVTGFSPGLRVSPKDWRLMYAGNTPYHPEDVERLDETEEHQVDEKKEARFLTGGSPLNLSPGVDLARELFTPSTEEEIKKIRNESIIFRYGPFGGYSNDGEDTVETSDAPEQHYKKLRQMIEISRNVVIYFKAEDSFDN